MAPRVEMRAQTLRWGSRKMSVNPPNSISAPSQIRNWPGSRLIERTVYCDSRLNVTE